MLFLAQSSQALQSFIVADCSTYFSESSLMSTEILHCDANSGIDAELNVIICAGLMLL